MSHADSYTDAEHYLGCATGAYVGVDAVKVVTGKDFLAPACITLSTCFAYEAVNHDGPGQDVRFLKDLGFEFGGILLNGLLEGSIKL